jgi:hypothetical protein
MATGWTWDYVWETMTFQKLEAFGRMWKKNPPPHISVAQVSAMLKAFFGVKDKEIDRGNVPEPILPGFMTQPDMEE